jgi:hypothetical protein
MLQRSPSCFGSSSRPPIRITWPLPLLVDSLTGSSAQHSSYTLLYGCGYTPQKHCAYPCCASCCLAHSSCPVHQVAFVLYLVTSVTSTCLHLARSVATCAPANPPPITSTLSGMCCWRQNGSCTDVYRRKPIRGQRLSSKRQSGLVTGRLHSQERREPGCTQQRVWR